MKKRQLKQLHREIALLKELVQVELNSVRQAVIEAKSNYVADKASSNEFRGQLKDQASSFVTRRELWGAVGATVGAVIAIGTVVLSFLSYIK